MSAEGFPAATFDEGLEAQRRGDDARALAALARCLDASPAHGPSHLAAALSSFHMGDWDKGLAHARTAAACMPDNPLAWTRVAQGLRAASQPAAALDAVQRALALDAGLAEAWTVRGSLAQDAGDLAAAQAHHRKALGLAPTLATARMGLAECDEARGSLDDADEGYREAAALDPTLADVPYNRGRLHHLRTGRLDEAAASYREAIALRPAFAHAHHNLAHALLLSGRFGAAWSEYRWRPPRLRYEAHLRNGGRTYELPRADALRGKRVRILGEQGLGDTLFFLRFAPLLRAQGAVLEFAGDPRLNGMLSRTGLFDAIGIEIDEERDAIDVLAGDLPLLLPPGEAGAAPAPLALTPEPAALARASERLAALGPAPHVALAWRAGVAQGGVYETLFKELPLAALGGALKGVQATWISLQREPRSGETAELSRHLASPVHDLSAVNEDLEDALAWMSLVEGWVGVSNTNIHLRAGAARDARVLVPFPPEWRWMASGPSPWFPQARTYRQSASHSWDEALAQLRADLR